METIVVLKSWKLKAKRRKPQIFQIEIMLQSHIRISYPSKLQLPMGMENSPMYKIVEKTFKPKGLNVLSINCKVWIL